MTATADTKWNLSRLDADLGRTLKSALRSGRPAPNVILSVLARTVELDAPAPFVRSWMTRRVADAKVLALVADSDTWKHLVARARGHARESSPAVRLRVARRAVASILRDDLNAGERALVALLAVRILDDPRGWETTQITRRLAVDLGVSHETVQARVRSLVAKGVLVNLTTGRSGVPARVKFNRLRRDVGDMLDANPAACALVTALSIQGDLPTTDAAHTADDARSVFRAIVEPSIGYGDLSDHAWSYVLLRALNTEHLLSAGQIARARRTFKTAGLDLRVKSNDSALIERFPDLARDLSDGAPTDERAAREEERRERADARADSAAVSRTAERIAYQSTTLDPLRSLILSTEQDGTWLTTLEGIDDRRLDDLRDGSLLARLGLLASLWDRIEDDYDLLPLRRALSGEKLTDDDIAEIDDDAMRDLVDQMNRRTLTAKLARDCRDGAIDLRALPDQTVLTNALRKIVHGRALQKGRSAIALAEAITLLFPTDADEKAHTRALPWLIERAGALPRRADDADSYALRGWSESAAPLVAAMSLRKQQANALRAALRRELRLAGWDTRSAERALAVAMPDAKKKG
ncbi:hypothetical protein ABE10_11395 [Bacillus toyonensis]|nr:hypothetical protein [Bacillus toyonensis]